MFISLSQTKNCLNIEKKNNHVHASTNKYDVFFIRMNLFSIFDDDNNFGRLSLLNTDEFNENNKICWVPKEHDSDKLFSMKLFIASHCKINNFIPN